MTTSKVFFAGALGAFVGSLIALQIYHGFWWIGFFAGFGVGYLTYEFKKVVAVIPSAWQKASGWRWHPNKEWWGRYMKLWLPATIAASTVFAPIWIMMPPPWIVTLFGILISSALLGSVISKNLIRPGFPDRTNADVKDLLSFNPIHVYCWVLPKCLATGIWWLTSRIPAGIRILASFFWNLFKIIHSEIRLLCGVDAALGAAIGYHFESALVGAIAGGLLGVLNFEIFSIRILKVAAGSAIAIPSLTSASRHHNQPLRHIPERLFLLGGLGGVAPIGGAGSIPLEVRGRLNILLRSKNADYSGVVLRQGCLTCIWCRCAPRMRTIEPHFSRDSSVPEHLGWNCGALSAPKRRFESSHRNRPRMRGSNRMAA